MVLLISGMTVTPTAVSTRPAASIPSVTVCMNIAETGESARCAKTSLKSTLAIASRMLIKICNDKPHMVPVGLRLLHGSICRGSDEERRGAGVGEAGWW